MLANHHVVRLTVILGLVIALGAGALVFFKPDAEDRLEQCGAEMVRYPNGDVAFVQLYGNRLTDEDLADLKGMNRVRRLYFRGPKNISDAGMVHVAELTSLQRLKLTGTQVGDEGMHHLKTLTGLRILILDDTNVSDDGLVHLAGMSRLYALNLEGTNVTDRGLQHLQGLSNLQNLNVTNTQITAEGIDRCKQLLPGCNVIDHSREGASGS